MESLRTVTADGWINGLGALLGALISGLLSLLIALSIFSKERKEAKQKEEDKMVATNEAIGIIIENVVAHLLGFVATATVGVMDEKEFKKQKEHRIKDLKMIVEGINELDGIYPLDVPKESIKNFLHARHILKILKHDLLRILNYDELDTLESYKNADIVRRFYKIIESLTNIYSDGIFSPESLNEIKADLNKITKTNSETKG